MPMIDVYASDGTFPDPHDLARDLAAAVMRWSGSQIRVVPGEHGGFIYQLPPTVISNVDGHSNYIRVQVLTPTGALDRENSSGWSRS